MSYGTSRMMSSADEKSSGLLRRPFRLVERSGTSARAVAVGVEAAENSWKTLPSTERARGGQAIQGKGFGRCTLSSTHSRRRVGKARLLTRSVDSSTRYHVGRSAEGAL